VSEVRKEYEALAVRHAAAAADKKRLTLDAARRNRVPIQWTGYVPPTPKRPGITTFDDFALAELVPYIDWTPFFQAWELAGKFPAILDDETVGAAARSLYDDARGLLDRIVAEKWLVARGVAGLWPANSVGDDDIEVYADETRQTALATIHTLRQQMEKTDGRANLALADFIAPKDTGLDDYIGAFAVTAGHNEDEIAERFKRDNDDYSAIMVKALADRLAEAFAERLHEIVRRELWGYAPDERLSNEDLIAEAYRGIRPAPGYPACPDHTEKATIWRLLDVEARTGMKLTPSFAMWPGASVSGLYFSNAEAEYFGVGKIDRDQVEDYARRKGTSVAEIERWLAPNLNYTPTRERS
jgi:5-methyltetrahydrofolate--homocysteine methyltransferase